MQYTCNYFTNWAHSLVQSQTDKMGAMAAQLKQAAECLGEGDCEKAGEALGQSLDIIIPERLREAHWAGFRKAMETGATRLGGAPTLTRALHQTGRRLYVEMSFAVILGAEGKALGAVAVAREAPARS